MIDDERSVEWNGDKLTLREVALVAACLLSLLAYVLASNGFHRFIGEVQLAISKLLIFT